MNWWSQPIDQVLRWRARRKKRKLHAKGDREGLIKSIWKEAANAEAEGDADRMRSCSYKLMRFGLFERGWELRIGAALLREQSPLPEWDGGDLVGRTLLIRPHVPKKRIGEELRSSRFIAPVAQKAERCIVLAEHRLVPLFKRSFPGIEARPRETDADQAYAEADVAAYYDTIAFHYAKDTEAMKRCFVPLRADQALVAAMRQRYRMKSTGPLIGISWGSSTKHKILPNLQDWRPLLALPSVTFVSLQYGDIARDLEVLQELSGGRVISDPEVDQLVDLDSFAAQITALDAVVSISNTTVDMAGTVGTPTVYIRDDNPDAIWAGSGPSPWYPAIRILYKEGRPWSEAFVDAKARIEEIIAAPVASAQS
jgi:hypothetical protein